MAKKIILTKIPPLSPEIRKSITENIFFFNESFRDYLLLKDEINKLENSCFICNKKLIDHKNYYKVYGDNYFNLLLKFYFCNNCKKLIESGLLSKDEVSKEIKNKKVELKLIKELKIQGK